MYFLCLSVALIICLYTAIDGKAQYVRFAKIKSSPKRIARYQVWLSQSWLLFGLFALIAFLTTGQTAHILHPFVSPNLSALLKPVLSDPGATSGFVTGLVGGLAMTVAIVIIRARQGKSVPTIGNVAALLPRNRQERNYGISLALTAAVTEELFFRAMLPVLILGAFHDITLALWGSVGLFALMHYYQGWKGVAGTFVLGAILMQLFVFSGSILVPIAAHAFIDLNSLIALPALSAAVKRAKA